MLLMLSSHQGETVIDLGSGAGFDVFLAAKKVGSTGKAIGVDFNKVSHLGFPQETRKYQELTL